MVNIVVQTVGTKVVNDESVPLTGRYIPIKSPGTFPAIGVRATGTKVGQDSPKGKGTFYVALKAEAAATQSWQVICNSSALNTASFKLTTSWAVYSMPYDATSCQVGFIRTIWFTVWSDFASDCDSTCMGRICA